MVVLKTPLHQMHQELGAKLGEFAGWEMPIVYQGIFAEHRHTRRGVSIFDVSHMGRLKISGSQAEELLEHTLTSRVAVLEVGQCRYGLMCGPDGSVLDDVVLCRFEDHWLVVCNASNREKIVGWLGEHAGGRVRLEDITLDTAMLAVQGPRTWPVASRILPFDLPDLKRFRFATGNYMLMPYSVSRTGYTGEDGLEVIVPTKAAGFAWSYLTDADPADPDDKITPAGLGARDTLRIEAGLPLYGQELTEDIDPISAGLSRFVDLDKDFIGKEAIQRIVEEGPAAVRVGLELADRRTARAGSSVYSDERSVGTITSGVFSPTLERSIAMGYVGCEFSHPGQELLVDVRGRRIPAKVVALPFYRVSGYVGPQARKGAAGV